MRKILKFSYPLLLTGQMKSFKFMSFMSTSNKQNDQKDQSQQEKINFLRNEEYKLKKNDPSMNFNENSPKDEQLQKQDRRPKKDQMDENQKQKLLIKQILEQNFKNIIQKFRKILYIITALSSIYGAYYLYTNSSEYHWKQAEKECGDKYLPIIPDEYVPGGYVEKQMKQIIQLEIKNLIKIVAGLPGIGKSASLNYLIKQFKEQKKQVYYLNLKAMNQQIRSHKNIIIELDNYLEGVFRKYRGKKLEKKKSIKLIIDDINILESLDKYECNSILKKISEFHIDPNIDVICISSSDLFVQKLNEESWIDKASEFFILQDLQNQEDYGRFAGKVINSYFPNITPVVRNYMIQQKYNLRKITTKIDKMKKIESETIQETEKKQMKFLEDGDIIQLESLSNQAQKIIKKINSKQMARQLISGILNNPQRLEIINCVKISRKARQKTHEKQTFDISEIIEQLSHKNLLIYCRPRAQIERKVFQNVLQKLQMAINNTNDK